MDDPLRSASQNQIEHSEKPSPAGAVGRGPVTQLKRELAGLSYSEQAARVAPPPVAPSEGGAAVVQRKVDAQFDEDLEPRTDGSRGARAGVQMMSDAGAAPDIAASTGGDTLSSPTPSLGVMFPVGEHTGLAFVQMTGGGGTSGGATGTTTGTPAEVTYKWVSKTVDGKQVHYLVEDPKGDVKLGPVQRTPIAENVALETKVRAFELTVGSHAEGHSGAKEAARAMATKVVQVVDAFLKTLYSIKKEADTINDKFAKILGGTDTIWAGTIGDDRNIIKQAAKGGNLRETLTMVNNFIYNFGAEFINSGGQAQLTEIMGKVSGENKALEDRLKVMVDSDNRVVSNEMIKDQFKEQNEIRDYAPAGTDKQTKKTVGDLRAELKKKHPLSKRELEALGLTEADGVSKEELDNKRLDWNEGMRAFVIKEHEDIVQKLRAAAVPLGAGVSGTTARIMANGQLLGFTDAIMLRAACIGYLIPIRAHTLWEVLQGAVAGGAPAVPAHLGAFKQIEPFGDSSKIYPDAEFWTAVDDTIKKVGG